MDRDLFCRGPGGVGLLKWLPSRVPASSPEPVSVTWQLSQDCHWAQSTVREGFPAGGRREAQPRWERWVGTTPRANSQSERRS